MGVRVKVKVEHVSTGRSVVTSALVNTGFEARRPTVRMPVGLARELGVTDEDLRTAEEAVFIVGDGRAVHFTVLRDAFRISVEAEDRIEGPVLADALILYGSGELVLNDTLTQLLKIVPAMPRDGLWRFSDEPPDRLRESTERRVWHPRP